MTKIRKNDENAKNAIFFIFSIFGHFYILYVDKFWKNAVFSDGYFPVFLAKISPFLTKS